MDDDSCYTDRNKKPSRAGLEEHQHWVWMRDVPLPRPQIPIPGEEPASVPEGSGRWVIVGTGAKF